MTGAEPEPAGGRPLRRETVCFYFQYYLLILFIYNINNNCNVMTGAEPEPARSRPLRRDAVRLRCAQGGRRAGAPY